MGDAGMGKMERAPALPVNAIQCFVLCIGN